MFQLLYLKTPHILSFPSFTSFQNATVCFQHKHTEAWKRIEPCLDEGDTHGNPCGGYEMCVEAEAANVDSECGKYKEKVINCCEPPPPAECQMEKEVGVGCLVLQLFNWRVCVKIHSINVPHLLSSTRFFPNLTPLYRQLLSKPA